MSTTMNHEAEVPEHVPSHLVHDIDIYNLPGLVDGFTDDIHLLWKTIQDRCPPVIWTPRNGGHWMLMRYDVIQEVGMNPQAFSSKDIFVPRGTAPLLTPVNLDPPDHMHFRKLLMPVFSPAALAGATARAHEAAVEVINNLLPRGQCEFVSEFSSIIPVVVFMSLVNLPMKDLDFLREVAGMSTPDNPDGPKGWEILSGYVRQQIDMRRKAPQDDWITSLLDAKVDGRPVTDQEIFSMVLLAISGGLDTVVTATGFFASFLAQNPGHRRQLIEHPEIIDQASEELMRRLGVSNIGRVATQDVSVGGVTMKKDDSALMIFTLAGLDDTLHEDPMTVDFARKSTRHLLFGTGPHSCMGNRLAKRELKIFLEEWLKRIPDFELAPGSRPKMKSGVTNRLAQLDLVW